MKLIQKVIKVNQFGGLGIFFYKDIRNLYDIKEGDKVKITKVK